MSVALWGIFAFVTWNVIFDREVNVAAVRFTRAQILRYQAGQPVSSIDEAFTPDVHRAALVASGWTGLVIVAGAAVYLRFLRRPGGRPSSPAPESQ